MNEQERRAVERLRTFCAFVPDGLFTACGQAYHDHASADGARLKLRDDLAMVLVALAGRPTTCFECETELQGPFCPKCTQVTLDRLSAPVRS